MTPARAAALHAYYTVARAEVLAIRSYADDSVPIRLLRPFPGVAERRMVHQLCDLLGVSYEERAALLVLAGHPFAPTWAMEMYREMPDDRAQRRTTR